MNAMSFALNGNIALSCVVLYTLVHQGATQADRLSRRLPAWRSGPRTLFRSASSRSPPWLPSLPSTTLPRWASTSTPSRQSSLIDRAQVLCFTDSLVRPPFERTALSCLSSIASASCSRSSSSRTRISRLEPTTTEDRSLSWRESPSISRSRLLSALIGLLLCCFQLPCLARWFLLRSQPRGERAAMGRPLSLQQRSLLGDLSLVGRPSAVRDEPRRSSARLFHVEPQSTSLFPLRSASSYETSTTGPHFCTLCSFFLAQLVSRTSAPAPALNALSRLLALDHVPVFALSPL